MKRSDEGALYHVRMYQEFERVVGEPPPKIKCRGGQLSPQAEARLRQRPDLRRWALGEETTTNGY